MFRKYLLTSLASAMGMSIALVIFMYRHAIGHGIAFGIPWYHIGIICLAILGLFGVLAVFGIVMYFTKGWIIPVLVILMVVGIVQGLSQPDMYRGYESQILRISSENPQTKPGITLWHITIPSTL